MDSPQRTLINPACKAQQSQPTGASGPPREEYQKNSPRHLWKGADRVPESFSSHLGSCSVHVYICWHDHGQSQLLASVNNQTKSERCVCLFNQYLQYLQAVFKLHGNTIGTKCQGVNLMLCSNLGGVSCRYASKITGIISVASSSCREPALEIILFLSGCDRADGLFNSVMNVVAETFNSAAGREDSSLSTSALFYAALIDYHEASSSPVIMILIPYRSRRRESGSKVKFAQGWERWPEHFSMRSRQLTISFGQTEDAEWWLDTPTMKDIQDKDNSTVEELVVFHEVDGGSQ